MADKQLEYTLKENFTLAQLPPEAFARLICNSRRQRPPSWLSVLTIIAANVLLFFCLGWINQAHRRQLVREDWAAEEIFPVDIPPPDRHTLEETTPEIVEIPARRVETEPMELAPQEPQWLEPRLFDWTAEMPLEMARFRVDTVSLPEEITRPGKTTTNPGPWELSQVDRYPQKIYGALPSYPYGASGEGVVTLRFIVDSKGKVSQIEIKSNKGDLRFAQAAAQTVAQWQFRPALVADKPVACWCIQRIYFNLRE